MLGVAVCCKVQIQPAIASDPTDGEIRYMYKAVNKIKFIWRYKEALKFHTGAPTVNWEENTICIYVVEAKRVTTRVKHIDISVCSQQEKLTMVSLFQNMMSIVSCRQICVPNHVQVQFLAIIPNA